MDTAVTGLRIRYRIRTDFMVSSRPITLFAPPPRPVGGSPSWAVSAVVHVGLCAWFCYGLAHTPHLQTHSAHQRFTVRVLDVPITKPEAMYYPSPNPAPTARQASAARGLTAPVSIVKQAADAARTEESGQSQARPAPALPASIQLAQNAHQQQTLIQPDAPKDMVLERQTPVPMVMMWAQQQPVKPVLAAPPPKPVVADLHTSMARPNRETAPAAINVSSTNFHSALPMLTPGTTSPIVVRGPEPVKQMPAAAAQTNTPPAPVRIISLSDRQQQEGPVAVPLANASARPSTSQSLTAGKAEGPGGTGAANAAGKQQIANGAGQSAGAGAGQGAAAAVSQSGGVKQAANAAGSAKPDAGPGTAPQTTAGIGTENGGTVKRIVLPKDGQFAAVVVGSSLTDQYPETAAIWAGRLVYTVYLHVGPGKSWILQYSVPADTQGAVTGVRPDAPWPYDIVVPRLAEADYNSDAVMVHGFVNETGKFERLNIVLPEEFAQAKFVLNALGQWQFRAARQNGQPTPVEVLLIIPEEDD